MGKFCLIFRNTALHFRLLSLALNLLAYDLDFTALALDLVTFNFRFLIFAWISARPL